MDLVGKKIFVNLKNGKQFSGIVKEAKEMGDKTLIVILDKFSKHVGFLDSEILMIKEEKE